MSLSPLDSAIFAPLFNDPAIAAIFNDDRWVQSCVAVEVTLATVQGQLGVIPAEVVSPIQQGGATFTPDMGTLRSGTENAGFPIIELVRQLRAHIGGSAADYVHWGATTQDIMDTALVLQLRATLEVIEPMVEAVITGLAAVAEKHRHTLMAGRTHSQQALPISFGFKVAGWLAPLVRHRQRLGELKPRLFVVQFGGAVATLAALGQAGVAVQQAVAAELALGVPAMPWHTQRDTIAEFGSWLSLVTGSLAKMAQDIILLAQSEIAEVAESSDRSRGGSSTMPQKRNPIVSELIVAAARTNAGHLATLHHALIQEQERGTHGWQLEWITLPPMIGLTASALTKAQWLSENLVVDEARMMANIKASNGMMLAEALTFALAEVMSRTEAKQVVQAAVKRATDEGRHLVDVVAEQSQAPLPWDTLRDEANYLGAADGFIDLVLASVFRS